MMRRARVVGLMALLLFAGCQSSPSQKRGVDTAEERRKLAEINTQLALAYMRDGDNELAMRKLEKAIEADPKSVGAHTAMALLHARLGQTDEAERSYRSALSLDPQNAAALNNYGQFLCQQKRYDEGLAKFQDAVKNPLNRTPESALTNAGLCAQQSGDLAGAEQHFRAALQRVPTLTPALLAMAQLSLEQQNHLQARGYYQRYLAVGPQNPRTLWLGIRIEHALEDRDAEASYALQLKNRFPDSPEYGLYQQGKFD
ncbi:MAG: type IV pilus biogenesis/stability protein PilW [Gammaproteobacteria bacterium]